MRYLLIIVFIGFGCFPAHAGRATPTIVAGCVANAATNCTWSNLSGKSASVGDLLYYFAFRTATTAPTAPGSTTNLDTASASTSSFRSGCQVLTTTTPAAITATNATRILVIIIHNTNATSTADCKTAGVGFHTTAGASGTTSTYTFTGGTLTVTDGSSLVIGEVGSSTAPCTPSSLTNNATLSSTDIFENDTNGGVSSFSTTTCAGTTGNWKTDTVEFIGACTSGVCHVQGHSTESTSSGSNSWTFSFTPKATNDAVLFSVSCNETGAGVATNTTLSASGWTITQLTAFATQGAVTIASFGAIAPNTSAATFTATFTGKSDCGNDTLATQDEFNGNDTTGGTTTFDAHNSATAASGTPTMTVTPANNDDGLWGSNYNGATGIGAGFILGTTTNAASFTEYNILSGQSGVGQTVNWAAAGSAWVAVGATVKPVSAGGVAGYPRLMTMGIGD